MFKGRSCRMHLLNINDRLSINDTAEAEIKALAALALISRALNVLQREDIVSL